MGESPRRVALETARSFLFVPGNRPDRFAKAEGSGADIVILDLEDAVPPAAKEASRRAVVDWAMTHERSLVRVNGVGTPWMADEMRELRGSGVPLMLPKAERVDDLRRAQDMVDGAPIVALVETPLGVVSALEMATSGAVARLALGNVDLAATLGVDPASRAALFYARGSLVLASAVADLVTPVDGVTTRLDDDSALADDVAHGHEMGFSGKLCIHPRQVPTVNAGMCPSAEEVEWAHRIVAVARDGVGIVDGAMVDAPVVARARQILARVDATTV